MRTKPKVSTCYTDEPDLTKTFPQHVILTVILGLLHPCAVLPYPHKIDHPQTTFSLLLGQWGFSLAVLSSLWLSRAFAVVSPFLDSVVDIAACLTAHRARQGIPFQAQCHALYEYCSSAVSFSADFVQIRQ